MSQVRSFGCNCFKSYRKFYSHSIRRRLLSTASVNLSSIDPPPDLLSLSSDSGYARLTTRGLVYVYGHDSPRFLQGLTTANVPSPPSSSTRGFYSAFLNAQGRVLHDVFIYPATTNHVRPDTLQSSIEQGFMIEVDADEVDSLAKWLKRYKLRAKVSIEKIENGEWAVYGAWNRDGYSFLDGSQSLPLTDSSPPSGLLALDDRARAFGLRVLLPARHSDSSQRAFLADENHLVVNNQVLNECPVEDYHIRRMIWGIPEGQNEIQKEAALPQESNLDYMLGIDFRKGCYVGQELTIRTHHTGVVRKRIIPVSLMPMDMNDSINEESPIDCPPPGIKPWIVCGGGKNKGVGKWLSGVGNMGLALFRLETKTLRPNTCTIQWEDAQGDSTKQFIIVPQIPKWHREREEMIGLKKV